MDPRVKHIPLSAWYPWIKLSDIDFGVQIDLNPPPSGEISRTVPWNPFISRPMGHIKLITSDIQQNSKILNLSSDLLLLISRQAGIGCYILGLCQSIYQLLSPFFVWDDSIFQTSDNVVGFFRHEPYDAYEWNQAYGFGFELRVDGTWRGLLLTLDFMQKQVDEHREGTWSLNKRHEVVFHHPKEHDKKDLQPKTMKSEKLIFGTCEQRVIEFAYDLDQPKIRPPRGEKRGRI